MAEMATAGAAEKAQAFAHRLVEFADRNACLKFFSERSVDFDRPNDMGWSVLMSVCACGRDDLVGLVIDQTTTCHSSTKTNHTTVLHLAAIAKNPLVIQELTATAERRKKLEPIVTQPNVHGDTALMMACVAKNVTAVQVLLLMLHASVAAVNMDGMTALMCAARASDDPRPGAPSHEELMARSAELVRLLLSHGAEVNAVESAGGNTSLHLAVLTENVDAVECLLASGSDIDLNWRNLAGNTAMDLSNRSSGVVSATIGELLSIKLAQREEAAAQQSEQVERELAALAMKEAEDAEERKVNGNAGSKKSKKSKKKAKKTSDKAKKATNGDAETLQEHNETVDVEGESANEGNERRTEGSLESPPRRESVATNFPNGRPEGAHMPSGHLESSSENGEESWQRVLPKKPRRKASIGEKTSTPAKQQGKKPHHRTSTSNRSAKKSPAPASRPASMSIPSVVSSSAPQPPDSRPAMTWVTEAKHGVPEVPRSAATTPFSASPRSQQDTEDEADAAASTTAYDQLNTSFQRTFPVAAELEIGVEKFLIASSASDRELEPTDSLSMSQIEALQEAHWQAYHYLNEKKIELTRVLEAQRVEAQFALQQELMQMK